jgi:hypothetical protein
MATLTLGTNATTTLTALVFSPNMTIADLATMQELIKNDAPVAGTDPSKYPIFPGGFSNSGLLYIPNRGVLKCKPGDYVGIDHSGWPILVSADSIADATTSWSHS